MTSLKRVIGVFLILILILSVGAAATYIFVKPEYKVYVNDKIVSGSSDLLFNYNGYTYTKNSELCKLLNIKFTWNESKRESRFYSKDYVTPSKTIITNSPTPTISKTDTISNIVYITKTGKKYHKSGCRYLKDSCIKINKSEAIKKGYSACSVCKP